LRLAALRRRRNAAPRRRHDRVAIVRLIQVRIISQLWIDADATTHYGYSHESPKQRQKTTKLRG